MFDVRDEIINLFEKGTFSYKDKTVKTKEKEELEENKLFEYIEDELKDISYELFEKHFNVVAPTVLAKKLYETKDKKKNNDLVNVIKSRLCDLKNEIEKMSEDEIEIEKPNEIVQIVDEIIDFNNKIQKQ